MTDETRGKATSESGKATGVESDRQLSGRTEGTGHSQSGDAVGVSYVGDRAPQTTAGTAERTKVFISHSSEDDALADAMVSLLVNGCGMAREDIFSSSTRGHGIPPGQHFGEYIRETLHETAVNISLISSRFLESQWCLVELGATWVFDDVFRLPVLVPPTGPDDLGGLGGVMREIEAIRLTDVGSLSDLADSVAERLGTRSSSRQRSAAADAAWSRLQETLELDSDKEP